LLTSRKAPPLVCYTLPMFIHRNAVIGHSSRGAWPWRRPRYLRS